MTVLGSVSARWLIHAGAIEMSFTILLCYALAVSFGHVKAWLPTISACGEHPPEQYPFRFGIMLGAILLEVEAIALYTAKKTSHLTFVLGAIAAFCLGVVAVVAANENNIVHTTAAVIFFVFEDIMSVLLTIGLMGKITYCSLGMKISSSSVACVSTLIRLLLMMNYLPTTEEFPLLPIVEWSNTAAIVVFQLSLASDIHNLFVSITEPSPSVPVTKGTLLHVTNDYQHEAISAGPLPSKKEVVVSLEVKDTH